MTLQDRNRSWYARVGKRAFDLLVGGVLLFFLLPIHLVVGLAILAVDGRPVFFRQPRPGKDEAPFEMIKFRTMRPLPVDRNEDDAYRTTPLGRFLRRSSLDELPQLWCVVRGHMSLVGPRPLLMEYLPRYTLEQARRHSVRPGLTGWAQIHGRNLISWEQKFEHDLWYVDHYSIGLDLKILVITLTKVLHGEGISAPGHHTAPKFRGSHRRK